MAGPHNGTRNSPRSGGQVGELLLRHDNSIRRFISRRSGPHVLRRVTLDDLYQQTAAAAMDSSDGFVYYDDASFMSWVQTIARRVIWTSLDQRKHRPPTLRIKGARSSGAGVGESELGGSGRTPSSLVAGIEHEAGMLRAIRTLPEHYREALTLYKLEQRPLNEVAQALGRTRGSTCALINRAIRHLRNQLNAQ